MRKLLAARVTLGGSLLRAGIGGFEIGTKLRELALPLRQASLALL